MHFYRNSSFLSQLAKFIFCLSLFGTSSFAELIDIGQDRKMYIECQGKGSPPVIFISGTGDNADIWNKISLETAKFTHACAYDRPGTFTIKNKETIIPGRSTLFTRSITPKDGVADLHALLAAAKVQGPYVLVAHSYGGLIARLYASMYPDAVAGLILIDTLTEYLYDFFTPKEQALWIRINSKHSPEIDRVAHQERMDFIPGFQQLRQAPIPKAMPVIVLTSDQTYDMKALIEQGVIPDDSPVEFGDIIFKNHLKAQRKLAGIYNAKLITNTNAGHYIQVEQPELVVSSIREVVDRVRKTQ